MSHLFVELAKGKRSLAEAAGSLYALALLDFTDETGDSVLNVCFLGGPKEAKGSQGK